MYAHAIRIPCVNLVVAAFEPSFQTAMAIKEIAAAKKPSFSPTNYIETIIRVNLTAAKLVEQNISTQAGGLFKKSTTLGIVIIKPATPMTIALGIWKQKSAKAPPGKEACIYPIAATI